jgi:hypothetical protein
VGLYDDGDVAERVGLQRLVTFYLTNFPEKVTHFQLCKVFVVYGLLENVYVAQKLNARGQRSGFARFSRVKEVTKLFYAITDIRFE